MAQKKTAQAPPRRKIGVMIESLRLGVEKGILKAKEIGADGFQIYCTYGELEPENLSRSQRKDFKAFVKKTGLEISALCGDLGQGFLNKKTNPHVIAKSKQYVDLAVDLGVKIITTHMGEIPHRRVSKTYRLGVEAVREVAGYAEQKGVRFASETGPEPPRNLWRFLQDVRSKGMAVNYDPANLIMLGPFDHLGGVQLLRDYIIHTHAKDGVCLWQGTRGVWSNQFLEVPLGEGAVCFPYYLAMLEAIGYRGFLTIEREVGENPVAEITQAIRFLRRVRSKPLKRLSLKDVHPAGAE